MNEKLKALSCKNVAKTECPNRFQPSILNAALVQIGLTKNGYVTLSPQDVDKVDRSCTDCPGYVEVSQ